MDAFFLYVEAEEQPMHVGAVCIFEGKIPFRKFLQTLEARLDEIPRYRQRVMTAPFNLGHPTWEFDPDFDIDNHLIRVQVNAPGTDKELRDLTSQIWTGLLDRGKPLWELYFVEGLSDKRTALIAKVHHCMVDGIAGIGLLYVLMDLVPNPPKKKKKPFKAAPLPENSELLYDALWDNAIESVEHWTRFQRNVVEYGRGMGSLQVGEALRKFGSTLGHFLLPYTRLPFNGPLNGVRKASWRSFPFADIRAIRAVCGGTINDVMLTVLSGAILRYLDGHPQRRRRYRSLRVLAPVNVRQEAERGTLGNHISFMPIEIPLALDDAVERLHAIHLRTKELKESRVPEAIGLMFDVLQGSPAILQALSLNTVARPAVQNVLGKVIPIPPANLICTNVPGPQIPLYSCGQRMTAIYPKVPVCLEMGINCAITTYDQKVYVNLVADGQAGYDVDLVMEYFEQAMHELREAAAIKEAAYVRIIRETNTETPREAPSAKTAAAEAGSDQSHSQGNGHGNGNGHSNGNGAALLKKRPAPKKSAARDKANRSS
jgi:WS/DGAT/MGAT family acyltransferase